MYKMNTIMTTTDKIRQNLINDDSAHYHLIMNLCDIIDDQAKTLKSIESLFLSPVQEHEVTK